MTRARLAADATEVHRDLNDPKGAFAWNELAEPMPADCFTRATGIRVELARVLLRTLARAGRHPGRHGAVQR